MREGTIDPERRAPPPHPGDPPAIDREARAPASAEGAAARRRLAPVVVGVAVLAAFLAYAAGNTTNPPGFYLDESSIAYNAWTIARSGVDEHGRPWPVFFQTWDPSVTANPVYIYLLAAVFAVFGPSILAARLLSAVVGFLAAVVLGALGTAASGDRRVGIIVSGIALLTPWLFEVSRLVFEVALFPLVVAAYLLLLFLAQKRAVWPLAWSIGLGVLLGVLTYTYTIGRALGPLLALGLIMFATRRRMGSLVVTWVTYAVTLIPLALFNVANAGALTARANLLGYFTPGMSLADRAAAVIDHVLVNVAPHYLLLTGDPNPRHHVAVTGSFLVGALVLVLAGVDHVAHRHRGERWWHYVAYGLAAALLPASLTVDEFHTLRLVAVPILLLVLTIPAVHLAVGGRTRLIRAVTGGAIVVALVQGMYFQVQFHRVGPDRGAVFDAVYPEILDAALADGTRPIHLLDRGDLPGYIHAYWYGTLRGVDPSAFVRLPTGALPPDGALVVGTDRSCGACEVILERGDYIVYRARNAPQAGLITNGDFEQLGGSRLDTFGAPIHGWSQSAYAALQAGGARTRGAHVVLRHGDGGGTARSIDSARAAVDGGATVALEAFARGEPGHEARLTIALVETDAGGAFVTWHTVAATVGTGEDWTRQRIDGVELDPRTRSVHVSIFLEPGDVGDAAHVDDVVVDYVD